MVHVNIQNIQTHLQFGTVIFPKSRQKILLGYVKYKKNYTTVMLLQVLLTIFQLPVWILRCCCRWQSCLKPLSQNEQMCLRIPVCTKLCCASCCLLLKPLLQFGQRWVRSGWTVELTSTKCWSLEVSWESSGVMSELSVGWDRLRSEIMSSSLKRKA